MIHSGFGSLYEPRIAILRATRAFHRFLIVAPLFAASRRSLSSLTLKPHLALLFALFAIAAPLRADTLSLAGSWEVSLHEPETADAAWRSIALPGTLDDAQIGEPLALQPELNMRVLTALQRRHSYVGPAWYRREVTIPAAWAGRSIVLELERVLWESRAFVDGREVSRADSLTTPHRHDLGAALTPGRHVLMLRIDNREIYRDVSHHIRRYKPAEFEPVAHAYTNHTQVMWNGALGFMRLRAAPPVAIERLAVFPRLAPSPALGLDFTFTGADAGASDATGTLTLTLRRRGETEVIAESRQPFAVAPGERVKHLDWTLPPNTEIVAWDEFSPALYRIEASFDGSRGVAASAEFGFRELAARDAEFRLNGRRLFLRGNLDGAAFPLTGYPPTAVADWRKLLGTAREWGLNHLRFHSWCPPKAAFIAADELGFYLQVELPHWFENLAGHDAASWAFLEAEADRMLAEYGNHPSFALLSLGNELQGDYDRLNALVCRLRDRDPRRLYTTTTFTFQKGFGRTPQPADDFFITQYTQDGWVRGQGVFNEQSPAFDADYRAAAANIALPLVTHEIGQYAVFPDLREIPRYTGNLVPLNFIAVRDDLAKKGLLDLAPQFTAASGRFAALLYKEEIERALRTPQLDGFQLLQLQDFPGQGTALVGLLNAFWESKGVVTPADFRQACAPFVPLARFPKAVYERGETFRATVEVANFLREIPAAEFTWTMRDERERVIGEGAFEPTPLPIGNGHEIGAIAVPIPPEGRAAKWRLEVAVRGTEYRNSWSIWVYPRDVMDAPAGVRLVNTLAEAQRALAAGERVLFAPPTAEIKGIEGKFVPVFWSPVHFPKQPGTMGVLCDPAHPALRDFPTDVHSDWQWWDPARRSRSVVLDGLAATPIVRVIDNFNRNHSLANVFEARVGAGRLIFCAIDITTDLATRPAARQLRASLLRYMASPDFAPKDSLNADELAGLLIQK